MKGEQVHRNFQRRLGILGLEVSFSGAHQLSWFGRGPEGSRALTSPLQPPSAGSTPWASALREEAAAEGPCVGETQPPRDWELGAALQGHWAKERQDRMAGAASDEESSPRGEFSEPSGLVSR